MNLYKTIIIILIYSSFCSAKFTDFYATEDSLGNTIIIYRNGDTFLFNVNENTERKIFHNYYDTNALGETYASIYHGTRFWRKNTNLYITINDYITPIADGSSIIHYKYGMVLDNPGENFEKVIISQQNDSLIYVVVNRYTHWYFSSDFGRSWQKMNSNFKLASISPFEENKIFGIESSSHYLVMSKDNGETYSAVISRHLNIYFSSLNFYYDIDSLHVYFYEWDRTSWHLIRSSDGGNNWNEVHSESDYSRICLDESNSGIVYLAKNNEIYISTDYGIKFAFYRSLNEPCIFLYKKPNSTLLYAATQNNIFQISPDTTIVIKSIATSIFKRESQKIQNDIVLNQNYPNPFNSTTIITYKLKTKSSVQLTIYDISGKLIKTIVNETQSPGQHSISFDADDLASGVYFYKLKTASFEQSRKMLLLR